MRLCVALLGIVVAVAVGIPVASAHDGAKHGKANAKAPAATSTAKNGAPGKDFGIEVGGPFALVDHTGAARTDQDFHGRYMLVFFGYANCESICPVGLKTMTDAVDLLGDAGAAITPVLITVDPQRDVPAALAVSVAKIHPRLVGLTGSEAALAATRKSYNVSVKAVEGEWGKDAVLAHGSFIYLMGKQGEFLTLMPPVFGADRMAKTINKYLRAGAS